MMNVLGLFRNASADKIRTFPAGATILEAGTPPTCMYVVRRGRLSIRIGGVEIDTVEQGDIVGELSLIDDVERSATVEALTDCELVAVDKRHFEFLVQQTPFFALEVMRVMAERLRAANRRALAR